MFLLIALPLAYADNGDQVHLGRSISVGPDENAGNLVCIGCSIRMEGRCGDVVAIGGSISIDGTARGDAVAIGGAMRLGEDATVAGDVVTVGGRLWRHPNATVKGHVSSRPGVVILLGLLLTPFIPLILLIAFIVWLFRRNRRYSPATAPGQH